ncbi:winged helix-turn-helix domain-containing protein [Aliikangiella coralliicola]|uniref:Transcriptional regulator n=1 Tax=Aliikangiella coralliicola TaxID=2592383 RepID=A0A545U8X3_9GAMM|nr:winged helix-turn-helix domain-containing protein [Aliikangiella coralliicola]TQV85917.1 transcriptional regulator [Aliikangiella coralliicola]
MSAQYWVGGFFIDLSRNQITQNRQSQTIAPKALAVLTYLAENQGQVVSQDALLSKVWQDTAVSPNTLQKSIAQLRKALGEEGNLYIKTHAKQGYSLECDVRWQDNVNSTISESAISDSAVSESTIAESATASGSAKDSDSLRDASSLKNSLDESQIKHSKGSIDLTPETAPSNTNFKLISIIAGVIILAIIGYQNLTPTKSQISFDQLRLLTATDDKEFDATYSPDGQYIVFHRYLDKQCVNKIWAKNTSTQKEFQLTQDWGAYGRHSFSIDGKKMVFLATEPCTEPVDQKYCHDLVSLDFEKALESPQQPKVILQCKNSLVKKPVWLSDNKIALMKRHANRWKLIIYSPGDNSSRDLYDVNDGNLIDFAYSAKRNLIAVTSVHKDGKHYVEMLNPDGDILSSHTIERPPAIPKFRPIYPNFTPSHEQLIFSTGKQLFTLSFDGKVAKISSPFSDSMAQPEFHPDGKKLLMIKGPYDSDIVKLPLNQLAELNHSPLTTQTTQPNQIQSTQFQNRLPQSYTSIERTNVGEDFAIFQPEGELIAFWSERSGEPQIWISDGNDPKQVSRFPMDTYIRGFDWAADGKSLLVNANSILTQVFLDSNQKNFSLNYPVIRLFQWDSKNNSALLAISVNGKPIAVEYDFSNSEFKEISDKTILWAQKSEDGRLIYKDHLDQFWQSGPVEDRQIKSLTNQRSKAKGFMINGNVLYAFNRKNQLWSYDLDNESFKILGDFDKSIDYLTDINQTHLLMTIQVAAKKEVVELSLSE